MSTRMVDDRYALAELCNDYGVRNAAEIGTDRGEFAVEFLKRWTGGGTLLCIDPYESYENMPWPRHMDAWVAAVRLAPFGDRVRFIPLPSPEAAAEIHREWHLQFCYIDGNHEYAAVKADLHAWWNRLDPGGILAGHDFADHRGGYVQMDDAVKWMAHEDWTHGNGVVRAAMEFACARYATVHLTNDCPRSWYMFKPR